MINENKLITPVILGGDLGAYSMARAFAESLGVISYVFARDRLAICDCSVFTKLIVIKDLDKPDVATSVLIEFAKEHNEEALILVPTSDWYMKVLQYSRNDLSDYFFYIPDFKLWESLSDKSKFYEVLSEYGIDYPKSITCSEETIDSIAEKIAGLKQPYVLKPADSSLYWKYPFEGMKKVYFPLSCDEIYMYAKKIYDSGYPGKIIIQERIFDDFKDGYITEPISSVLTTYSNREGKVVRAVLGDVLLEEKSQTARGNYSSIITKPIDSFSKKIIAMLDKLGYIGIANFDILNFKGKQICLELNARAGRSSDYLRAAGINLASMFVKDMSGIFTEKTYEYKEILWTAAPIKCLNGEAIEKRLLPRAKTVFLKNGYSSPFDSELDRGIIRRIYLLVHEMRQMRIFERQSKEVIKCSLPKS